MDIVSENPHPERGGVERKTVSRKLTALAIIFSGWLAMR